MASQPSDKLKAILAEARARADASRATGTAPVSTRETHRVEALLDRNEELPDPRALARMYRQKSLVEQLPEDDDHAAPPPVAPAPPPTHVEDLPERGPALYTPPVTRLPAEPRPDHAPLSPDQIREVMNELRQQFTSHEYATYEPRPLPEEVIPFADEPDEEEGAPPVADTAGIFYVIGTILALVLIGGFVLLAVNGPLRYRPPTPTPSAPSTSAR